LSIRNPWPVHYAPAYPQAVKSSWLCVATAAQAGPMKQNLPAGEHSPQPALSESPAERKIRVGSPTTLLAVVPHLLGFVPSSSMVVIGTEPEFSRIKLTLRYDLPDPPDPEAAADISDHAAGVLRAQCIHSAVAVGYGPGRLVTPVTDALRTRAPSAGLEVAEILRVENGHYWSHTCTEPGCCPADGTPFDIADHPAAAALAATGAPVLGGREQLAATVASVDGDAAESMQRATHHAQEHAARLVARVARSGRRGSARRLIATAGLGAVADAIAACRRGDRLDSDYQVAWLTVVLRDVRVRDDAWARMDPAHRDAHRRLWTDVTRRARPGYVAAPASLLAFVAWQSGNGALANVALDRALAEDPGYSMARLLRQVIDGGAPPSVARLPMTPEEVAASYDDLDEDADDLGEDMDDDPYGEDLDGEDLDWGA
jgi:Domain of unknown function (DUF4192)